MKKQVYEIDELGFFKNIKIKEFDNEGNCLESLAENIIITDLPQGFYKAKWNGNEWIDNITQEEIDELNNQPHELTETEMIMLAIAELDTQREIDKTEAELLLLN